MAAYIKLSHSVPNCDTQSARVTKLCKSLSNAGTKSFTPKSDDPVILWSRGGISTKEQDKLLITKTFSPARHLLAGFQLARFSAFKPFALRSNSIMRRAIMVGKVIRTKPSPNMARMRYPMSELFMVIWIILII